jgi:DNA-directed RNA polymerase I, II, and III subunit RPABC2
MPPKGSKLPRSTKLPKSTKTVVKAKKVEDVKDVTDDIDEPDKLSNVGTDEEIVDSDDEGPPELEVIRTEVKEKYEYNPIQTATIIYVRPEERIMSEVMTKFEYTEIISIRAKQLEDHDQAFTDIGDLSDPLDMAKKEIADKRCPLSIVRERTTEGGVTIAELWHVNEMGIPSD